MKGAIAVLLALALADPAAAERGAVLFAGGAWAAIDRGAVCEAESRSLRAAPTDKVQAVAGLSFTADRRRWGEFHAHLSRIPRPGTSVMLMIGDQPFLLVSRGDWGWSSGPAQEQAIIAAMRSAAAMKVEAHDLAGARFADPYLLDGAPTAIDAAAARCAGKNEAR